MDIYLLVRISICVALLILFLLQTKRKPEQVILEEKPAIEVFMTNKSPTEVLMTAQSVVASKRGRLYEMSEDTAIFMRDTSLWNTGYVLTIEITNHNKQFNKVIFSLYPKSSIILGTGRHMKKAALKMVNILCDRLNLE